MSNRQLIKTKDNSSTIFVPGLNQHYHSIHGAVQESQHVFIEAGFGLKDVLDEIKVFELGFGTGLNALMTQNEAIKKNIKCQYWTVEKYPLKEEEYSKLNYPEIFNSEGKNEQFTKLHQCVWDQPVALNPLFELHKIKGDVKKLKLKENYFDLIYFDAFAPSSQADLWTIEIFTKMFNCLKDEGVLVTYCVKGEVRRNMIEAGFEVEKIPGPPGKREMARAFAIKSK